MKITKGFLATIFEDNKTLRFHCQQARAPVLNMLLDGKHKEVNMKRDENRKRERNTKGLLEKLLLRI